MGHLHRAAGVLEPGRRRPRVPGAGDRPGRERRPDPGDPAPGRSTAPAGCTGSTVTLGAAADSWVLQSSAGQNDGTDSVLKLETKSGADARPYVRFNLPAIPAGRQVTSARLRLYASSYKTGRTLQAFRVGGAVDRERASTGPTSRRRPGPRRRPLRARATASGRSRSMWSTCTRRTPTTASRSATPSPNGNMPQEFHSREKGPTTRRDRWSRSACEDGEGGIRTLGRG